MDGRGGTVGFATGYVVLRVLLIALYVRARHVRRRRRPQALRDIHRRLLGHDRALARLDLRARSISVRAVGRGDGRPTSSSPLAAWAIAEGARRRRLAPHRAIRHVLHHRPRRIAWWPWWRGSPGSSCTSSRGSSPALCFVIALCLWWIYFDLADTSVVGRGALGLVYVYSHFPLLAGVAAFGVGTKLAIGEAVQAGLSAGTRWALAGGIGAFALSLAALHVGAEWTSLRDRTFIGRLRPGRVRPRAGGGRRRHRAARICRARCRRGASAAVTRGVDP